MAGRHSRANDEYREPNRHTIARGGGRETAVDDRRRKEPKIRRVEEPMDVDMVDDDSDDYDPRQRGGKRTTDKYSSSARNPTIPATAGARHRDRTPPEETNRAIINAIPERDQPRVRPGSDRDFWIPDAGIEREVITYEITRYLGQDALVRPGKNDKGQSGFLITAFRAPTTEMIRSMKEASEKFLREMQSRSRPAAYSSSRTATGRDKDLGQYSEREQQPGRRRGGYDSDDSMDDAPPIGRAYDRDYDRREREPEPRRADRHGRDTRDDRQIPDPRYQDARVQDPRYQDARVQDPRYQDARVQDPRGQDTRGQDSRMYQQDSRLMPDSRMQDPRMMQDPRYPERYQDPRDIPVNPGRHQAYTSAYQEPPIPGYTLSPSAQPAGFDYNMAQPRGYSNNTPPPVARGGQPMYVPASGYPAVSQGPQVMVDRNGRPIGLVPIPAGYTQEPRGDRHARR